MNKSIKIRAIAFVASIVVTFGIIDTMAYYAYPAAPTAVVASAAR